jgi:hypothetical protein
MVNRPGTPVCRSCGLPIARPADPLRGTLPGWFRPMHQGPSLAMSVLGLALVVGVLLVGGTLTLSGDGVLRYGGRLGLAPSASPSAAATGSSRPGALQGAAPTATAPATILPQEATDEPVSRYSCDDAEITDVTRSRWRLQTVRAGSRRRFERVVLELARTGGAERRGAVKLQWMSPEEARTTFGLPRFDGRRGVLITFGAPFSTSSAQLIGPADLRDERIESMSGVYRFIDRDGATRVFIALRDDSCVRFAAPQLEGQDDRGRRASITLDFAR